MQLNFNLNQLKERLSEFGLNPIDWRLELKSILGDVARVEIHPVQNASLCFEGWVKKENWMGIRLREN